MQNLTKMQQDIRVHSRKQLTPARMQLAPQGGVHIQTWIN